MPVMKIPSVSDQKEQAPALRDEHVLEIIRTLRQIAEELERIGDKLDSVTGTMDNRKHFIRTGNVL
jgi:hypothetical protein